MTRIRVLVVEDSLTVRKRIVQVLAADAELEVVGEATDGREAIELCGALHPDVVTLDMMMPVMSGLAVTEYIMAYCPTPILIVSASTNRGEVYKTYDALAAGAVDVLDKPQGDEADDVWSRALVKAIKLVARIKVITHLRARIAARSPEPVGPSSSSASAPASGVRVVGIGVSTGGPTALVKILSGLPIDFPIPILITQHLSRVFAENFGDWLDAQTPLRVTLAQDGQPLPKVGVGGVFIAPADRHLVVRGGVLRLTNDPERHSCRPSVDVLFASLAAELGAAAAGILLTGMGRDGAAGLLDMRRAGGRTIAQDEASCVVFGMPREAILLGAAERTLGLDEMAPAILALAAGASSTRRSP
jgi:two-component system, chemotaxis family, protein-glutamate methylesterase/glutaminase